MTEYIVLEQLDKGNIQLDEVVKISNEVFRAETSPIQVTSKDKTTVRDLLHALLLTGIIVPHLPLQNTLLETKIISLS